jgi:hypothetical protein
MNNHSAALGPCFSPIVSTSDFSTRRGADTRRKLRSMEKSRQPVRWMVLLLSCLLMIGNYYCFDNPAALKSQLQQRFSQFPKERYEFLFVRPRFQQGVGGRTD